MTVETRLRRPISEAEVAAYAADGVVHLKGLFGPELVERLRDLVEADMAKHSRMQLELSKEGDPGRFYGNTFVWKQTPGFREVVYESGLAEAAGRIMAAGKVNIVFDQLLVKEPGTSERTRWHHDLPYWPILGDQVATLWLALDEVTAESGAVEYIRGSHLWGQRFKAEAFKEGVEYQEDLPPVPDIEAERARHEILQFELAPGDCTLHHGLTLHAAPGNARADRRRRAYVTRWAGDDVTYHPRPGIQPMYEDPAIAAGDALDSDLWPVVWRSGPGDALRRT